MRRRLAAVSLCVLAGALPLGCGNERANAPSLASPQRPGKFERFVYTAAELRFSAPRNWAQRPGSPPVVAAVASGRATIAITRYRRREPLPTTRTQLEDARAALTAAAKARDRGLTIRASRLVTVRGFPGIQLLADQTIDGQRRRVRSTHLFARRAEYVIDASAPPGMFPKVDRTVFAPVVASVQPGPAPLGSK